MLAAAGGDDPAGTLRPLLTAALDNALNYGDAALTGPIVRGDVNTVRDHLAEITGSTPQNLASYVAMARATLTRARLLPIRAAKISGLLDQSSALVDAPAAEPRTRLPRVP
jgi:predicted short-subunit dehydrogenase-like oxidoreductase (DUF2520 family)